MTPLQVHYHPELFPTQHGVYVGVSDEVLLATASERLAQGPYVEVRAGFESKTLRTKGAESTNEPPCPTIGWT